MLAAESLREGARGAIGRRQAVRSVMLCRMNPLAHGSKARRLITTLAKCTAGRWRSSATYTFSDGDSEVRRSTARCRA